MSDGGGVEALGCLGCVPGIGVLIGVKVWVEWSVFICFIEDMRPSKSPNKSSFDIDSDAII